MIYHTSIVYVNWDNLYIVLYTPIYLWYYRCSVCEHALLPSVHTLREEWTCHYSQALLRNVNIEIEMSGRILTLNPGFLFWILSHSWFFSKATRKIRNGKPGFEASNIPSYQDYMYVSYIGHSLMHLVDLDLENSHLYFVKWQSRTRLITCSNLRDREYNLYLPQP